ncbi:uncharacterized protein LOC132042392 [Lycium ferocissimum]|uniref:uncharacterized protein LOC132042392 n=1 Tax=Lycium ferocissimum TaxID=112874 RepID=UPI0028153D6E|nr:uncharacterized protein LOC132042392 [Lycium ferocissimum]
MENMIRSFKHKIADFIELVKTKAIEVVVQHDERLLITVLTLFFASYLIVVFSRHLCKKRKNRKPKRVLTRSLSVGVLHGGELALQRLVDYHDAKAEVLSLDVPKPEAEFDALLNDDRPHFKALQRCIAKMEMCGKEMNAVMKLESAIREARSKGKSHEAYEFEMLLVETLIYQGKFDEARNHKCLDDKCITDARRPLYKAIISLSLPRSTEDPENCWKEFKQIRKDLKRSCNVKDAQLLDINTKFEKFKSVVMSLNGDIKEVKRKAQKIKK